MQEIEKKKILFVSAGGLGYGGVSSVIFSIVEDLYEQYEFGCVTFQRERERDNLFKQYGKIYKINCYPQNGKRDYLEVLTRPYKLYFGIRKICRQERINIIHCHNQYDAGICLLAAKHEAVKIRIAHSHNTNSSKKNNIVEFLYKEISRRLINKYSTKRIGCSIKACQQYYGTNDFQVIHNSIDLDKYSDKKKMEHKGLNFVHVGRFSFQKNQEFVIEVFNEIRKKNQDVHLFLVGVGEKKEIEKKQRQIKELGLENCVDILPGDMDISTIYAISDFMIFPSRYEGFGIVLLEAQAMNIKCYVSENIQKEVDLGLLDYLKLSDGPESWANHIMKDISQNKTSICKRELLEKYSKENIKTKYVELYETI